MCCVPFISLQKLANIYVYQLEADNKYAFNVFMEAHCILSFYDASPIQHHQHHHHRILYVVFNSQHQHLLLGCTVITSHSDRMGASQSINTIYCEWKCIVRFVLINHKMYTQSDRIDGGWSACAHFQCANMHSACYCSLVTIWFIWTEWKEQCIVINASELP